MVFSARANRLFDPPAEWARNATRLFWLKLTLVLALAVSLLLAPKLWLSSRSYPLIAVSDGLPLIPFPIDYLCFFALLALLGPIACLSRCQRWIAAFAVLLGLLSLWDQSRWQPPLYQYFFMLAALGFALGSRTSNEKDQWALATCRVIVASTYFWGGLQKLNYTFFRQVFPWMVKPLVAYLPAAMTYPVYALGLLVPFLEAGVGVALLMRRFRTPAVWIALGMHTLIVLLLGPLGHNWDLLVWPWNIAMGCTVVILFFGAEEENFQAIAMARRFLFGKVVLALFAVLPLLSFLDLWDAYLSWALYSGNTRYSVIYVSDAVRTQLPADVQALVRREGDGRGALHPFRWSMHDLKVEPYPEPRVYKQVARRVCRLTDDPAGVTLAIWGRPSLLDGTRRVTRYGCSDL